MKTNSRYLHQYECIENNHLTNFVKKKLKNSNMWQQAYLIFSIIVVVFSLTIFCMILFIDFIFTR